MSGILRIAAAVSAAGFGQTDEKPVQAKEGERDERIEDKGDDGEEDTGCDVQRGEHIAQH